MAEYNICVFIKLFIRWCNLGIKTSKILASSGTLPFVHMGFILHSPHWTQQPPQWEYIASQTVWSGLCQPMTEYLEEWFPGVGENGRGCIRFGNPQLLLRYNLKCIES